MRKMWWVQEKALILLVLFFLIGCVEDPTYATENVDVYCDSFCPDITEALTNQRAMWEENNFKWPDYFMVSFKDREFYGASGYLAGEDSIWILERGYPVWESVLDHEVGMIIFNAIDDGEGQAIDKRKELGICYPDGDTGYCKK